MWSANPISKPTKPIWEELRWRRRCPGVTLVAFVTLVTLVALLHCYIVRKGRFLVVFYYYFIASAEMSKTTRLFYKSCYFWSVPVWSGTPKTHFRIEKLCINQCFSLHLIGPNDEIWGFGSEVLVVKYYWKGLFFCLPSLIIIIMYFQDEQPRDPYQQPQFKGWKLCQWKVPIIFLTCLRL